MSKNLSGGLLYKILGNYDANKLSDNNYKYLNSNEYLIGKHLEQALEDKDSNLKYYFTCGIMGELAPDNPVIIVHEIIYDSDGKEISRDKSDQIYGCTSIEEWEKSNGTDPTNRKPIKKLESVQSERSEKLSQCFEEYRNKLSSKEREEVNQAIDGILNKMLFEAVKGNNIDKVRELVEGKYVDVDAKNKFGRTALTRASQEGHFEVVKFLLDHGAGTDIAGEDKLTALHFAAYCGYKDIVELLVKKGANVNTQDKGGYTPYNEPHKLDQKKMVNPS